MVLAAVRDELCRAPVPGLAARRAEVAALLRFAGDLVVVSGRLVIEAEVATRAVADRACREVTEVFGHVPEVWLLPTHGPTAHYRLRVARDAEHLARQTGLLDTRGRPVRGLPPPVVSGDVAAAAAIWRGAFLARGVLTEPGPRPALAITCPGPEAALALIGAARRLGITAKARVARGTDRVVVREAPMIEDLLTRMGAHQSVLSWQQRRIRRESQATAHQRENFADANLRRSARAATAAAARVSRALEILGDSTPEHLSTTGKLRAEHTQASLQELGQLADPPMTKDTVAGQIRRLLQTADNKAASLGIPNTESAITEDMLADYDGP